jgi:ABC-type bacteriocin/lantibiotic exporter with double-glycine peptidase domain
MNREALKEYIRLYRGAGARLGATVAASLLLAGLNLAIPFLLRIAFDRAVPDRNLPLLASIGGGIGALYLLSTGISAWSRAVILAVTKDAVRTLRERMLASLYDRSRAWFCAADRNAVQTMLVHDTERVDAMSSALLSQMVPAFAVALALSAALLWLDPLLFLLMGTLAPLLMAVRRFVGRRMRAAVREFRGAFEAYNKGMQFVLQAFDLTRIRSAEPVETARQRERIGALRATGERLSWYFSTYVSLHNTVVAFSGVLILVGGGYSVATGRMTPGELLSFYAGVALLKTPLQSLFGGVPQVIEGLESLGAIHRWLSDGERQPYGGTETPPLTGRISLDDVHFGFPGKPLLSGASLSVEPGEIVGIVGANGSGKSTLLDLALGFYRPEGGALSADGIPYDRIEMGHLRRAVSIVRQDPYLFQGTVAENIGYGRPGTGADEIRAAARLSGADAFVSALPDGYDTQIGEQGTLMSGGQRQRIAIARALLGAPSLLLLDEPTNHLDEESVRELMSGLRTIAPAPAILLVSHHREILGMCDRVLRLESGRLVESSPARA